MAVSVIGLIKAYSGSDNGSVNAGSVTDADLSWYAGHSDPSSFGRPTNTDKGIRYLGCRFYVKVAVLSDLSVYVSPDGGYIKTTKMPMGGAAGWPNAFLAASLKNFKLRPAKKGEGGTTEASAHKYFFLNETKYEYSKSIKEGAALVGGVNVFCTDFEILTTGEADGNISAVVSKSGGKEEIPDADDRVTKGLEITAEDVEKYMNNRGYFKIGSLKSVDPPASGHLDGTVYIGGLCLFNQDAPDSSKSIDAFPVTIPGLLEYLDYYPWARFDGSDWVSHNASGHSLKRYNGSAWVDVKNSYASDASRSKGFRHDGNGFAKSPKHGEGA